mmetsp:Transcript_6660/g.11648  ORF Transcript_6660/g.11648 Transcript_6660/m.11648 type:complete len:103 (+) Transcript_6660:418-726(+)
MMPRKLNRKAQPLVPTSTKHNPTQGLTKIGAGPPPGHAKRIRTIPLSCWPILSARACPFQLSMAAPALFIQPAGNLPKLDLQQCARAALVHFSHVPERAETA